MSPMVRAADYLCVTDSDDRHTNSSTFVEHSSLYRCELSIRLVANIISWVLDIVESNFRYYCTGTTHELKWQQPEQAIYQSATRHKSYDHLKKWTSLVYCNVLLKLKIHLKITSTRIDVSREVKKWAWHTIKAYINCCKK
jgi:hypothetical protein